MSVAVATMADEVVGMEVLCDQGLVAHAGLDLVEKQRERKKHEEAAKAAKAAATTTGSKTTADEAGDPAKRPASAGAVDPSQVMSVETVTDAG